MIRSSKADKATLLIVLVGAVLAGCATPVPDGRDSASPGRSATRAPALPETLPVLVARVPARLLVHSIGAPGAPAVPGAAAACFEQIEAFAELHSGNRVLLGSAAFANSDQLVLTRLPHRGPDGLPLDGRAAPPRPLVLYLFTGPRGCTVQTAEAGASSNAGAQTKVGDALPSSADVPACHCVPLRSTGPVK